jgi:hypothetical protein
MILKAPVPLDLDQIAPEPEIQTWDSFHGIHSVTDGRVLVQSYPPSLMFGLDGEWTHSVDIYIKPDTRRWANGFIYRGTDDREALRLAYEANPEAKEGAA